MNIYLGNSFELSVIQLPPGAKKLGLIWISPGTFMMGSKDGDVGYDPLEDEMAFQCVLSDGFWLGEYPVTQSQWQFVMGQNPSHFFRLENNINHPVENISWSEAINFCNRINNLLLHELPTKYRFSLPTEAQWEYACRAGTSSSFYSGEDESDLARVAWYAGNSEKQTHPVGEKFPNNWGLYDMHGNVCEWCYDSPIPYPNGTEIDWKGKESGLTRALRGGGWKESYSSGGLRSASRAGGFQDVKQPWIGFRVCLRQIE